MVNQQSIFKYKINKGILHKIPALVKLVLLLPLSIICMSLSIQWLLLGIGIAIIIAFLCKFTVREQITDLKPALYYAVIMYAISVINNIFYNWGLGSGVWGLGFFDFILKIFTPNFDLLHISNRLMLIIQISALLFRTTSSLEIRDSLCKINKSLGETISLFLSFIPQIFENWSIINKAWKARGGRNGLRRIKTTIFILISLSLEKASIKSKALESRRKKH